MKLQSETYQEISYEEKWLGGFSLKELLFLSPFLLSAYYIVFHSSLAIATRLVAAILPIALGLYLIYCEYDKKLGYFLAYLFRVRV